MSNTLKVVHMCSHILREDSIAMRSVAVTKSETLTDIIPDIIAKSVESIVVSDGTTRIPGIHFQLIGTNIIAWANTSLMPLAGEIYTAIVATKDSIVRNMGQEECIVCGGNGWYASATEITEKKIEISSDVEKMVQDFIKILLTDSRYASFGTAFKEVSTSAITDENAMKIKITNAIKDAESQIKRKQYELEMNGILVGDDEKLASANLVEADMDESTRTLYVHVDLITQSNLSIEIGVQS